MRVTRRDAPRDGAREGGRDGARDGGRDGARDGGRPLGVVYTPSAIAAPMVRLALEPLLRGRTPAELLALRVFDPAIGEGAFVIEVIEVIAGALVASSPGLVIAEAIRRVAAECVLGVDIDPRAVAAARAATGAPASALRVGDALAIDWPAELPEVFARGGFDAVVANPPYIRQERLTDKRTLKRFASYDGVADLYVYFIELAHQVLRPGGRYCLIVPNKWLTTAYGRPLRELLAAGTSVDGIADLSRADVFAEAEAFPCIVWGTATPERTTPIRAVRPEAIDAHGNLDSVLHDGGELIPRDRWRAGSWHLESGTERALIERLERELPRLGDLIPARPSRGVVTGCNRAFVIDRATRDRCVSADPAADALIRRFVKGRDLRPYHHVEAERFILLIDRGTSLDELPALAAHLAQFRTALEPRPAAWTGAWPGRKPGTYAWYELQDPVGPLIKARTPRLLYQDIQTAPACVLDALGDAVPDTTVWMLPTEDRFVLAVLNSPLYGWYARRRFPPALNGSVRPKAAYLSALPIPRISDVDRRSITELVERRLTTARERSRDLLAGALELEVQLATAIADAYRLTRAERALLAP